MHHHLTFEPRTPQSKALTLAVQHVAAAAEKEQKKKKRTLAPAPGRPCPHHLQPAPCWSLYTLRGPLRAANSRFHHAGERGPPMPVSACALLLLKLSLPCARIGRSLSGKERASAPAPPRFPDDAKIRAPGVHRSHCRQAPSLSLPSSVVQNSTGSRKNSKVVVVVGGTSPTETSPY